MTKSSKSEKQFAQNLFGGKESLYNEKENAKTKEQELIEMEE